MTSKGQALLGILALGALGAMASNNKRRVKHNPIEELEVVNEFELAEEVIREKELEMINELEFEALTDEELQEFEGLDKEEMYEQLFNESEEEDETTE
jgi:hypothetical protein